MKNVLNHPALENITQKVAAVTQEGVSRSKQMAEIAKLRLSNHNEEEAIKKAYMEIGRLYYAQYGTAPEGAYVALCSRISKSNDIIAANLAQMAQIKQVVVVTEEDYADDIQPEEAPQEAPATAEYEEEVAAEGVLTADEEAVAEEPVPDEE